MQLENSAGLSWFVHNKWIGTYEVDQKEISTILLRLSFFEIGHYSGYVKMCLNWFRSGLLVKYICVHETVFFVNNVNDFTFGKLDKETNSTFTAQGMLSPIHREVIPNRAVGSGNVIIFLWNVHW